jgi:LuxR family maltose regulon positive regulatory protein
MAETEHLLRTKIQIPQLPARMVSRSRLFDTLDAALLPFKRLTLLSAPAGYGKTSLVSAWVQDRQISTAWLSLDELDNDATRFTSYLFAGLQNADPNFTKPMLEIGSYAEGELKTAVLIPLLNQISTTDRTTMIVLDDYHWIKSLAVHQMVDFLLERLPNQAHMIIITRADPALPIARLRGRGQLNELRLEDLQFRPDEIRSFLTRFEDIQLSPDEVEILIQRTEGWIAGLQMAAISLQDHTDQSGIIQSFSGDHHYIMDFLLDEVLRRQPPQLQKFLLNTSILSRLCGPLCDAVLGAPPEREQPAGDVLAALEHNNLFILPLDQHREWFRYHRLFADLLLARLQSEGPEHIQNLHRRASRWFEEQNLMDEAIQHALLSEDTQIAADLVERASQEVLLRSETTTFLRWVQRLPVEEIAHRPRLGIYQAWALLFQGAPLRIVEAHLAGGRQGGDPPGGATLLDAFVALSRGQISEGLELAEAALEVLPLEEVYLHDLATFCVAGARIAAGDEESGQHLLEATTQAAQRSGNPSTAVIFLTELAETRMKQMKLDEAQELYQRALAAATDADGKRLPIAGRALTGLGSLALERYDLDSAEQLLVEGIQKTEHWSLISTLEAHLSLVIVHHARGKPEDVRNSFGLLYDLADRFDASEVDDLVVELTEARVNIWQGKEAAARDWISRRGLEKAPRYLPPAYSHDYLTTRLYKYELPVLIRLLIAEARFPEAGEAIDTLVNLAQEATRPFLVLEAEILRALLLQAQGQHQAAYNALGQALDLASPSGVMRLFLTEGETLVKLLRQGRSSWDDPARLAFVDQLLRAADPHHASQPQGPESLSPRELEVLLLMPGELGTQSMANELVISINTVRSHIKSIYAKLGVHSRHQAVEKARNLGLL